MIESGGEAGGYGLTGTIGDERYAFAGLDCETGFDGVAGAGDKLWLRWAKMHPDIVKRVGRFCYGIERAWRDG